MGREEFRFPSFIPGPGKTVREQNEVCTGFLIKKEDYEGFSGKYIKYGKRKAMEIATLGCAVMVKLDKEKKHIEEVRLGLRCSGSYPHSLPEGGGKPEGCGLHRYGKNGELCKYRLNRGSSQKLLESFQGVPFTGDFRVGKACFKGSHCFTRRTGQCLKLFILR